MMAGLPLSLSNSRSSPVTTRKSGGPRRVEKTSAGGLSSNQISPDSTTGPVRPRLLSRRERVLVAGDVYCGKSYLYFRMAQLAFERGEKSKFYLLDLDDTAPNFLSEGCEFEHLFCENGGNIYPFPAFEWAESAKTYRQIVSEVEVGDWLNVDTIGRLYEHAQKKTATDLGINIDDVAYQRGISKSGFAAFDGNQWNLVGRVLGAIFNHAVYQFKGHLMMTAHLRDIVESRANRTNLTMYQQIGFEPIGPPRMHGMMRTVLFLWANRKVTKDERGKITSSKIVRHLTVTKDRGGSMFDDREYDLDAWETLQAVRLETTAQHRQAQNVSKEEGETMEDADLADRNIDEDAPEI